MSGDGLEAPRSGAAYGAIADESAMEIINKHALRQGKSFMQSWKYGAVWKGCRELF